MSKRLTITYGGRELFDADAAEFSFHESGDDITVKAGGTPKPSLGELLRTAAEGRRNNGDREQLEETMT